MVPCHRGSCPDRFRRIQREPRTHDDRFPISLAHVNAPGFLGAAICGSAVHAEAASFMASCFCGPGFPFRGDVFSGGLDWDTFSCMSRCGSGRKVVHACSRRN